MKLYIRLAMGTASLYGLITAISDGGSDRAQAAVSPSTGRQLYAAHCAACHGTTGKGDGRAACDFSTPPADLTDAAIAAESDGALLRHLSHAPRPMPSYDNLLNDAERRQIVGYLRTLSSRGVR